MSPLARALVVDDDPGVRYTLREILESEGLAVEEAADGAAALVRLEAAPTDLVVDRPAHARHGRHGAPAPASPSGRARRGSCSSPRTARSARRSRR